MTIILVEQQVMAGQDRKLFETTSNQNTESRLQICSYLKGISNVISEKFISKTFIYNYT